MLHSANNFIYKVDILSLLLDKTLQPDKINEKVPVKEVSFLHKKAPILIIEYRCSNEVFYEKYFLAKTISLFLNLIERLMAVRRFMLFKLKPIFRWQKKYLLFL